jgi:hypothetical protein
MKISNPTPRANTVTELAAAVFPKNSVFVSPQVICCWNENCVYGFDPLTGQTLWMRKTPYDSCTILGDEENLFTVFPRVQQVVALDPSSGRELASSALPSGGACIYGTNIVFIQATGNENNYTLVISDLRDIYDKRRRALMVVDSADGNLTPQIPTAVLCDKLNNASMLQWLRDDRFLSFAVWATKSLQVYDLQTKKKLLPEDNKLLDFVPDVNVKLMMCEVELIGDRILVLFTKDSQFRNTNDPSGDDDKAFRFIYRQIQGSMGSPIGEGWIMLFDSAGKPCWSEPTKIENMYRVLEVPHRLPVLLFAIGRTKTDVQLNSLNQSTLIMAVDKRSGEFRFRKDFALNQIPLQSFRVSADLETQEIIFTTVYTQPIRMVKAFFPAESAVKE